MEHSVYREMLSALLDGELGGAEREAALAHMNGCADCRAYFGELTALRAALGELEEFDAPEGFAAGVLERLRAEGETAQTRADGAANVRKKHTAWRGFGALAACAAVVLLAVYALPNTLRMGSMGAGNSAADNAVYASPSSAPSASAGGPETPAAAAGATTADSPSGYAYTSGAGGAGAVEESILEKEDGAADNAATKTADTTTAATSSSSQETDNRTNAQQAGASYDAEGAGERLSVIGGETQMAPLTDPAEPMAPLSRPEAAEELPILTLSGEGAALWLAEHGWQGESGAWYADASALRALPETLTVVYSELSEGYDGAVYVELWEEEP